MRERCNGPRVDSLISIKSPKFWVNMANVYNEGWSFSRANCPRLNWIVAWGEHNGTSLLFKSQYSGEKACFLFPMKYGPTVLNLVRFFDYLTNYLQHHELNPRGDVKLMMAFNFPSRSLKHCEQVHCVKGRYTWAGVQVQVAYVYVILGHFPCNGYGCGIMKDLAELWKRIATFCFWVRGDAIVLDGFLVEILMLGMWSVPFMKGKDGGVVGLTVMISGVILWCGQGAGWSCVGLGGS